MKQFFVCLVSLVAATLLAGWAGAEEPSADTAATASPKGTRRVLILCGLAGDDEHRKLFADTVEKLHTALTTHHDVSSDNIVLLWGDETTDADGPALKGAGGVTSRDSIAAAVAGLEKSLSPDDALWVFVVGHAHYDGRFVWFNIAGDDLNHLDFGKLMANLRCREQVFFITTAVSGFYFKSLAAPGRVVIAATEPDLEVNETLFPHELAKVLADPPPLAEFDQDHDGQSTLFDLYLLTARAVAQSYADSMLLATEHSLLDDNGDGRGSEVQRDYLPEELGGRPAATRTKTPPTTGDGALARRIMLKHGE